jgi:hypothetical protein
MVFAKVGCLIMKINFQSICNAPEQELIDHGIMLANYDVTDPGTTNQNRIPPKGYESYRCVDVLGKEFVWMNEHFPKEKFTWYLWFESIFLVPEEMHTLLVLKWI